MSSNTPHVVCRDLLEAAGMFCTINVRLPEHARVEIVGVACRKTDDDSDRLPFVKGVSGEDLLLPTS